MSARSAAERARENDEDSVVRLQAMAKRDSHRRARETDVERTLLLQAISSRVFDEERTVRV